MTATLDDVVKTINVLTDAINGFGTRLTAVEARPTTAPVAVAEKAKGASPDQQMKDVLAEHRNWHSVNQAGEAVTPFPAGLAHDVTVTVTPRGGKATVTPVKKTRGIATAKALVVDAIRKGSAVKVEQHK